MHCGEHRVVTLKQGQDQHRRPGSDAAIRRVASTSTLASTVQTGRAVLVGVW
jgi:hypothetical protein